MTPLWLLLSLFLVSAEPALALKVSPVIMLRRADIRVEARVRPDAANAALALAWTSDAGTEGSTTPHLLEGEDGPILHVWTFRDQPPANYAFVAALFDAKGTRRATATAEIHTPEGTR